MSKDLENQPLLPMSYSKAPMLSGNFSGPAFDCLARQQAIEVREKCSLIEAASAMLGQEVEMANKYKIFGKGGGEEIMFAAETTDCCTRNLKQLCPDCVGWNVEVLYTQGGASEKAFNLSRGFTMTCGPFNRPTVEVTDGNGNKVGSLKDPCSCIPCNDNNFSIRDANDDTILTMNTGCCQWGLVCPLPCGPCSKVNFGIRDARTREKVGNLQKKIPGCCSYFFAPDVDNYRVDFGGIEDPGLKALVMAMTIFIDFRLFNDNANDNKGDEPPPSKE